MFFTHETIKIIIFHYLLYHYYLCVFLTTSKILDKLSKSVMGHTQSLAIPYVSGQDVPGRISDLRRLKFSVSKIQPSTKPLVKKSLSNPKLTCCSAFSSSFHFSNISRSSSMPWCSADSRFRCDQTTRTIILLLIKLKYFDKAHIQKHHLRYAAGSPIPSVKEACDLPATGL